MLSLVKFYSDTCAPCKSLEPILNQIDDSDDSIILTSVNIADNPGLVQEHYVRAVPTTLLFKDGIEISRKVGAGSLGEFRAWIDEFKNLTPAIVPNEVGGTTIELKINDKEEDTSGI